MIGPPQEISPDRIERMATVYKDEAQGSLPETGGDGRPAHQRQYHVFEARPFDCAAEECERVYRPAMWRPEFGIKVGLAGLLLFRAPVVIYGEKNRTVFPARGTEVEGRFPAITADFEAGAVTAGIQSERIQPASFRVVEKSFDIIQQFGIRQHRCRNLIAFLSGKRSFMDSH